MSRGNTKSILDLLSQRAAFKRDWISDAKHRALSDVQEKEQLSQIKAMPTRCS